MPHLSVDLDRHPRLRQLHRGRMRPGEWPPMRVARTVHRGRYEELPQSWGQFKQWIETQGLSITPELWECYVTGPERAAFNAFGEVGMREMTRNAEGATYTFWDYQRLRFPKNEGMRIDFAWGSPALAERVSAAHIDRNERKGKGASDHVPVVLEIAG